MNSMSRKRKVEYILSILGMGLIVYLSTDKWGDGFTWAFFAMIVVTSLMISSTHEMKRLYWRKQIWRCDVCGKKIDDTPEFIMTIHAGGRTKRYDTVKCMRNDIQEVLQ